MKGCQFAGSMKNCSRADDDQHDRHFDDDDGGVDRGGSLTPKIRSAVTAAVMNTAGRLNTAATGSPPGTGRGTRCPAERRRKAQAELVSRVTRLPDQPTATVAAPRAYPGSGPSR